MLFLPGLWCLTQAAPVLSAESRVIQDRNGGLIYWGGKYVNVKPSKQGDAIGRRSQVDQMDVTMQDDIVTVKVTGPYFYNYARNLNQTRTIPPGDLYIASQGWKVRGMPPHKEDVFEASEGWDYVISFEGKALYGLHFADIIWTRPQPGVGRFRANQAWRGGYGQRVDDAVVELTDTYLSFTFSVRNMRLGPEIGLHWTMMCGNDIIEGSAALPAIALDPTAADPAEAHAPGPVDGADAMADDVLLTPFSAAASPPAPVLPPPLIGSGGGGLPPGVIGVPLVMAVPLFFDDDDDDDGPPTGRSDDPPDNPVPVPVSEPATSAAILFGMFCLGTVVRVKQGRSKQRRAQPSKPSSR